MRNVWGNFMNDFMNERNYYLGFSCFPGIGPVKFNQIIKRFNSAKEAWFASKKDLEEALGERLSTKFEVFRNSFDLKVYANKLIEKQVRFLTIRDSEYPKLLKQSKKAPFVLYIKGKFDFSAKDSDKMIGVVGARKITVYGREVTKIFCEELALNGFVIVSGLALGVDAIAAQTALENGGKTIAVLGNGVDLCYPSANKNLYDQIVQSGGAVIAEVPIGETPGRGLFPARNRIIAGLSLGVLVTEGTEDSGSLITAECALADKRAVFAVPGPITSQMSKGPYKLIQKGAKLVTSAEDILREFKIIRGSTSAEVEPLKSLKVKRGDTKDEQKIIDLLQNEQLNFDQLVRKTGFDTSKIASTLSILEIKGFIKSDGSIYSL